MKVFFRYIKMDFRRSFLSWRFFCCILAGLLTMLFAGNYFIFKGEYSVEFILSNALGPAATFVIMIGIIPLFPYAGSYAQDYQENVIRYYSIRGGLRHYLISKYLIAIMAGMITYGITVLIFVGILTIYFPVSISDHTGAIGYELYLEKGQYLLYFLMCIFHHMLTVACMTATGFCISVFIPNPFVTYVMPMVVTLALMRFSDTWGISWKYTINMFIQTVVSYDTPLETWLMKFLPTLVYCVLLGTLAVGKGMQRIKG